MSDGALWIDQVKFSDIDLETLVGFVKKNKQVSIHCSSLPSGRNLDYDYYNLKYRVQTSSSETIPSNSEILFYDRYTDVNSLRRHIDLFIKYSPVRCDFMITVKEMGSRSYCKDFSKPYMTEGICAILVNFVLCSWSDLYLGIYLVP